MRGAGEYNPAMLVHGEQAIELLRPIPPTGKLESRGKIAAIWDKGSGAVIETESESIDLESGEPLLRTRSSMFIRGDKHTEGAKAFIQKRKPEWKDHGL